MTIGTVDGGGLATFEWMRHIRLLRATVGSLAEGFAGAMSSVNVVFFMGGNNYPLDFDRIEIGKVSRARATVMSNVPLAARPGREPLDELVTQAAEAVRVGGAYARARGLDATFEPDALTILERCRREREF